MNLQQLVRDKREDILRIAASHGASNVRLFGSVVRGEANPNSDIDLIVAFAEGRSLFDLIDLAQELEETLGLPIDLLTDDGISPYLRERILAEARTL